MEKELDRRHLNLAVVGVAGLLFLALIIAIPASPGAEMAGLEPSSTPVTRPGIEPGMATTDGPLVWYSNPEGGYAMLMPQEWAAFAEPVWLRGRTYPGVTKFGSSGNGQGYQGLTISVGGSDGSVYAGCEFASCDEIRAETLDDLEAALVSTPSQITEALNLHDTVGEVTIGGLPGRYERSGIRNNGLGAPWALYHAFAIRDGRPVIVAFDIWNLRFNRLVRNTPDLITGMIASFRFTGEPTVRLPAVEWQTIEVVDHGFSMDVPSDWIRDPTQTHTAVIGGRDGSLTVQTGEADGTFEWCEGEPAPQCEAALIGSMDQLVALLTPPSATYARPGVTTVSTAPIPLGEGDGTRLIVRTWPDDQGPRTRYLVAGIVGGRPVVIRWQPSGLAGRELRAMLETFRLLD